MVHEYAESGTFLSKVIREFGRWKMEIQRNASTLNSNSKLELPRSGPPLQLKLCQRHPDIVGG
jgi:hypothetical protein